MQKKKTLILNGAYYPINIVDWTGAAAYMFDENNLILAEYEDEFISTVNTKYKLPAVVVVDQSCRGKFRAMKFSKRKMFIRDNYTCAYCGKRYANTSNLNMDHIIPVSKPYYGKTSWTNCITSCYTCNNIKKRNRTPEEAGMKLLFQATVPKMDYEFAKRAGKSRDIPEQWVPYLPDVKEEPAVVEIVPELKFGRVPYKKEK